MLTQKPETKREAGHAPGLRGPHGGSLSSLNALLLALLADRRRGGILSANGRTLFLSEARWPQDEAPTIASSLAKRAHAAQG